VQLETLRTDLWRWTAPHPEWQPTDDDGTPASWPVDVGCVLYVTTGHAVFIDPLAPADDDAFWKWADERCRDREVAVLETIAFHRRSRDAFVERYRAATEPPPPVIALPFPLGEETMYWLVEHRAVVPGDLLVAGEDGELSLCPEPWLEYLSAKPSLDEAREALAPLLELDVELVLTSHGGPVREGGREALALVLAPA
jgi:hypothetical protein